MSVKAIKIVRASFKVTWLASILALVGLVSLPHLLPPLQRELYVVRGGSMEPQIPVGAAVIVRHRGAGDLRVGDVITFRGVNGTVVTHRIVDIPAAGGGVRTKGDASSAADTSMVAPTDVIGTVEVVIPAAGAVLTTLGSTIGIVATLGLLGGLLVAVWFMDELLRSVQRPIRRGTAVTRAN
ncbi:MAG: signal peptidase I [Chloroflexota bacterium]